MKEGEYCYKIATAEKALCDQLYKTKSISNYKELSELLFDDLRIEKQQLDKLDCNMVEKLALGYGNMNVKRFSSFLRRNGI